jgi:Ca-activated chloride channel family protein
MKMGTAIGVALADGVSRIKDSTAKNRVIILMTDGRSNSGTFAELQRKYQQANLGDAIGKCPEGKEDRQYRILSG